MRRQLAVAIFLLAVFVLATGRPAHPSVAADQIRVTVTRAGVTFQPQALPTGRLNLLVVNNLGRPITFAFAGRRTPSIRSHGQRTLSVALVNAGRYPFFVDGGASLHGVVVAGGPLARYALQMIGTFDTPVFAAAPPGDSHRLFIVQQGGLIRELIDGQLQPEPFLDLSKQVDFEDEDGLLSMVFAPDYQSTRRFYVYFDDRDGNVRLVEYKTSVGNPDQVEPGSARQVLFIAKPYSNHNGSMMEFGRDGYLYVSVGDGDAGVKNKPGAFAQTLDDLLGNILRIDPEHGDPYSVPADNPFVGQSGARPEIWDYGLRNPWRFWIDPTTNDLYIGDVQLGGPEEVDYVAGNVGGKNFGWPCFQGTVPFDDTAHCANPVAPIFEYDHTGGACAVIGGVTVHDSALPALRGAYLHGDLCTGKIAAFRVVGGEALDRRSLNVRLPGLDSFAFDGAGHVLLISTSGTVARLVQAP